MITVNLRDFYYWYDHDEFTEVSDEVAEELKKSSRYANSYERRMKRNKSISFNIEADYDTAAFYCTTNNPEEIAIKIEQHCFLCRAINTLPEKQGRRIEAHFSLGISRKDIAVAEGVSESSVNESINRGLKTMKIILNFYENAPVKCP